MSSTAPLDSAGDLDLLASIMAVPVDGVEGDGVGVAVGQVDAHCETGGRVPGGGDPTRTAGILEAARVGRVQRPGVARITRGGDGSVGGIVGVIGRVANDVVTIGTVGFHPGALRRRVCLDKRRCRSRSRRWSRSRSGSGGGSGSCEEQSIEHGVAAGQVRDRDLHVTADGPDLIGAVDERREGLGVQHGPAGHVGDLDLLAPAVVVPVEGVERDGVHLAVGQVDVYREAGGRVPGDGDPARTAGILETAHIGRVGRPGVGRVPGGVDKGVVGIAGVIGRGADDVVTIGTVSPHPGALRRRVRLDERDVRDRRGQGIGIRRRPRGIVGFHAVVEGSRREPCVLVALGGGGADLGEVDVVGRSFDHEALFVVGVGGPGQTDRRARGGFFSQVRRGAWQGFGRGESPVRDVLELPVVRISGGPREADVSRVAADCGGDVDRIRGRENLTRVEDTGDRLGQRHTVVRQGDQIGRLAVEQRAVVGGRVNSTNGSGAVDEQPGRAV